MAQNRAPSGYFPIGCDLLEPAGQRDRLRRVRSMDTSLLRSVPTGAQPVAQSQATFGNLIASGLN